MKDTEPNTFIALGIAFLCLCLGIGGCIALESYADYLQAETEAIKIEIRKQK